MQLDKTHIAIRERGWLEICDLSLQVIREHARPLFWAMLLGVLPMALVNALLLDWILHVEEFTQGHGFRYIWTMLQLVFIQAPLASIAVTVYLGDAMFLESTTARKIFKTIFQLKWRLVACQGIYRGVLLAWLLTLLLLLSTPSPGDFLLPALSIAVFFLRGFRPYINEIILLEKNPLSQRRDNLAQNTLTITRRSKALHGPSSGNLFAQYLGALCVALLLTVSIVMALWFSQGIFSGNWLWSNFTFRVLVPASMWIVAGYFAVVRYLSYIDLRIRQEGWAVELRLRAEAAQMARQFT